MAKQGFRQRQMARRVYDKPARGRRMAPSSYEETRLGDRERNIPFQLCWDCDAPGGWHKVHCPRRVEA